MAATHIGNPAGAVNIFDFGAPRVISGYAHKETISGGALVYVSGADSAIVSSGADSFSTADLYFEDDASGLAFNGIALYDAGSNQPIAVATDGVFILTAGDSVYGGQMVQCDSDIPNSVEALGSKAVPTAAEDPGMAGMAIGRALTSATSGQYCLVDIHA